MRYVLLVLLLLACGCADTPQQAPIAAQEDALIGGAGIHQVIQGFQLFHNEEFGGNGRTCETCHVLPSFQLSTAHVASAPNSSPLFSALDSDNYDGASYSLIRADALARVHVTLAPNVTVDEVDGVNVQVRPDGRYVVVFRRATPSSVNSALNDHLMWDGREGNNLAHQAISAVAEHAEPTRAVTQSEADAIAAFQRQLYSSPALVAYAMGGPAPELPRGRTTSERRGREFFVSGQLSAAAGAHGLCATCHSGPMLNTVNAFNPGDIAGLRFSGNRTSEFNERNLPTYTFRITAMTDMLNDNPNLGPPGVVRYPAGTVFTVVSPDPGVIVVDDPRDGIQDANNDGESDGYATPCISMTGCSIFDIPGDPPEALPNTGVAFHRTASLWGISHTAPYFHDNSAATLEEAAAHYVEFFAPTRNSMLAQADFLESLGNLPLAEFLRDMAGALVITEQDVQDIAAYMRLL